MCVFVCVYTYASVCIHPHLNHTLHADGSLHLCRCIGICVCMPWKVQGKLTAVCLCVCVCVSGYEVCVDVHSVNPVSFLAPGVCKDMADVV